MMPESTIASCAKTFQVDQDNIFSFFQTPQKHLRLPIEHKLETIAFQEYINILCIEFK